MSNSLLTAAGLYTAKFAQMKSRRLKALRARREKQREADFRTRALQARTRDGPNRHYGVLAGVNPALDRPPLEGAELQAAMDDWVAKERLTPEQRAQLERDTRFQAALGEGSVWDMTRRKSIPSRFHKRIDTLRPGTSRRNVVFDIRYKRSKPNDAMKHGIRFEEEALKRFERDYNVQTTKCGLFTHEEHAWLTTTPGK